MALEALRNQAYRIALIKETLGLLVNEGNFSGGIGSQFSNLTAQASNLYSSPANTISNIREKTFELRAAWYDWVQDMDDTTLDTDAWLYANSLPANKPFTMMSRMSSLTILPDSIRTALHLRNDMTPIALSVRELGEFILTPSSEAIPYPLLAEVPLDSVSARTAHSRREFATFAATPAAFGTRTMFYKNSIYIIHRRADAFNAAEIEINIDPAIENFTIVNPDIVFKSSLHGAQIATVPETLVVGPHQFASISFTGDEQDEIWYPVNRLHNNVMTPTRNLIIQLMNNDDDDRNNPGAAVPVVQPRTRALMLKISGKFYFRPCKGSNLVKFNYPNNALTGFGRQREIWDRNLSTVMIALGNHLNQCDLQIRQEYSDAVTNRIRNIMNNIHAGWGNNFNPMGTIFNTSSYILGAMTADQGGVDPILPASRNRIGRITCILLYLTAVFG